MKPFIVIEEHKVPKYKKNILVSPEYKTFQQKIDSSMKKLNIKLNSDLEKLEYLCDKFTHYKMDLDCCYINDIKCDTFMCVIHIS